MSAAAAPLVPAPGRWARLRAHVRRRLIDEGLERLDLRWRFRLVVVAFGLPFLGYIVWAATQQAAIEKRHVHDQARQRAAMMATRLDDFVGEVDRLLQSAAQLLGPAVGDPRELDRLIADMRRHLPRSTNQVAVWSLAGDNLAALERRAAVRKVNVADRAYFKETLARLDLAIEAPVVSRLTGIQSIQFARPLFDAEGRCVGVVTMAMRLEDLFARLDESGRMVDDALVTLIDRGGVILTRSIDASLWMGRTVPDLDSVRAMFARQTGALEHTSIDGEMRLSGYALSSRMKAITIVGVPIEAATAPVAARLLRELAIGLVLFGIALLIANHAAKWTIVALVQLAADAKVIGDGDLAHRTSVVDGGEIAVLAENFNRMAGQLQERDRELASQQSHLRAIADNMPAQIVYVDRDERYRFVNAYRGPFPGFVSAEMIGRTVREVRGKRLYAHLAPHLHDALAGTANVVETTSIVDGATYHFHTTYVPDRDANDRVGGVYAFTQDVTRQRIAENLRVESERRLRLITDNVPAMICHVDGERRFRFLNRGAQRWFRQPYAELLGRSFVDALPAFAAPRLDEFFRRAFAGETVDFEVEVPSSDGTRWANCMLVPDFDETRAVVVGLYGMIHDVTAAKEVSQRMERLANFDTLTGLANRLQFNEVLEQALAEELRAESTTALMFLDIDHFKQVNDRHGHATGDALLREFAQRLVEAVRPTDVVARLSGDEFVVLLQGLHSDEEPRFVARKIIATIRKPFMIDDRFLQVSTSIGIAIRRERDETASRLMRRADEALYDAKGEGRDRFRMAG